MAGNRFNRLPMSNDLFTYGGSITNAVEIFKLRDDINTVSYTHLTLPPPPYV